MSQSSRCQLTGYAFNILKAMLEDGSQRERAFYSLLHRKLDNAVMVPPETVSAEVATINSRVEFSTERGRTENRILARTGTAEVYGLHLPITTLPGLALLGLTEGETVAFEMPDGTMETIRLTRVCYQPEARRRPH